MKMMEVWRAMLLTNAALLSNLLQPNHRCEFPTSCFCFYPNRVFPTRASFSSTWRGFKVRFPTGALQRTTDLQLFWSSHFRESVLNQLGNIIAFFLRLTKTWRASSAALTGKCMTGKCLYQRASECASAGEGVGVLCHGELLATKRKWLHYWSNLWH